MERHSPALRHLRPQLAGRRPQTRRGPDVLERVLRGLRHPPPHRRGLRGPVRNLTGDTDFIDLLWPGKLIAEHKSRGRDLSRAQTQAQGYILNLQNDGRAADVPRYIIVSDFARIALHDLEEPDPARQTIEFRLHDLHRFIRHFAFIAGYETRRIDEEDPANFKATELLANLHDRLEEGCYAGHDLQRFMVRILFCLFAEDTGIFEPDSFRQFIVNRTRDDGSDLGARLNHLFDVLNRATPRPPGLDEDLAAFPYVNGELFAERLAFPDFNAAMRTALLECCRFRWEKISPAVFGSLFQNIMLPRERRQIGAHYTSERDILKLIRSLVLDDLRAEFDAISDMRLLDPACGCGNFLVIAYRELRRLEMEVLSARYGDAPEEVTLCPAGQVTVAQMFGIELEEWPVRIAEVGLWLMDHQMNQELFERYGGSRATVPLATSPRIRQANALEIDWNGVLPAERCTHILGNPPFVGAKYQTPAQRADTQAVAGAVPHAGLLDYVTGWYFKAIDYCQRNRAIRIAFVSTNSITQGEQVGVLWSELFRRGVIIHFAHRTFEWMSEARGRAHVHVVIVGWGIADRPGKRIFDYETDPEHPTVADARNIGPYLVEGSNTAVRNRSRPLCNVPEIAIGNKPIDDGQYLFTPEERREFLALEPAAAPFFRRWIGSEEFINGIERWCLWLGDCPPDALRRMPHCLDRVEAVRRFRAASRSAPTRQIANTPTRVHVENMPAERYLVVPEVSSERRPYIPIGFVEPRNSGQQPRQDHPGRHPLPLRHPYLRHAHGLGPPGLRPSQIRLPILGQTGLQQLPLAAGRDRGPAPARRGDRRGRPRCPGPLPQLHSGRPLRPQRHAPRPSRCPHRTRPQG
ncbi:MAG: DNA methyltransferase [Phycisphaerales bacterium]